MRTPHYKELQGVSSSLSKKRHPNYVDITPVADQPHADPRTEVKARRPLNRKVVVRGWRHLYLQNDGQWFGKTRIILKAPHHGPCTPSPVPTYDDDDHHYCYHEDYYYCY